MTSSDFRSRAALLVATLALSVAVIGRVGAASLGLTTQQARTAAPSAIDPLRLNASEGASLSFARADHQHPWATLAMTTGGSSTEALACGNSPCLVGVTPTAILNPSNNRFQCLIQNVGLNPVYCSHSTTSTLSVITYQFALKPAVTLTSIDGGAYSCSQGQTTWRGPISCITGTGASTLAVSAGGL
jgi:hypothetical protein